MISETPILLYLVGAPFRPVVHPPEQTRAIATNLMVEMVFLNDCVAFNCSFELIK